MGRRHGAYGQETLPHRWLRRAKPAFGLEAVLIGLYGDDAYDAMMWFLDNEILLAVALIVTGGLLVVAWRWWSGLDEQAPSATP